MKKVFQKTCMLPVLMLLFVMILSVNAQAATGKFASDDTMIGCGNGKGSGEYDVYAYHLRNYATCGHADDDEIINFEGFYGLHVACNGTKVTCYFYNHMQNELKGSVVIQQYGNSKKTLELGQIDKDRLVSFDMKDVAKKCLSDNCPAELFIVGFKRSGSDHMSASTVLYFDGKKVQTCWITGLANFKDTIDRWNQTIGNCDPKDFLEMYVGNKNNPITYPTSGLYGDCNHVRQWRELSHEIVLHDDWNDETKVFAMVIWLSRNCAYDDYRVIYKNNKSRATLAGVWDDDNLWMYYNHVGQCWDFANALTIMCREQGIPCTSVDNPEHTACAVWLNDEWVCIDVSSLAKYHCKKEDTDKINWVLQRSGRFDTNYGVYVRSFDTINQGLCTPITATSDKPNPQ